MAPISEITTRKRRYTQSTSSTEKRSRPLTRTDSQHLKPDIANSPSNSIPSSPVTSPWTHALGSTSSLERRSSAGTLTDTIDDADSRHSESEAPGRTHSNARETDSTNEGQAENGAGHGTILSDSEIRTVIEEILSSNAEDASQDSIPTVTELLAGISLPTPEDVDALLNSLPSSTESNNDQPSTGTEGQKVEQETTPASSQLPKIGHFQLIKLLDDSSVVYDAVNTLNGEKMIARRLDYNKHIRRLCLARRLAQRIEYLQEDQRIYRLLFPKKMTFLVHKEKEEKSDKEVLYYYWFEPATYGTLHAHVNARGRLTEIQSKDYFRQICQVVEFCHRRGVIIRDLKLRKFVFADARRQLVKLDNLDETIICPDPPSKPEIYQPYPGDDTRTDRLGCPAYVSPEILDLSKRSYSGRAADVWSLGVLLYSLLMGRYPFFDATAAGLFTKIRLGRIQFPDKDGVPMDARLLIRGILRLDPTERPCLLDILAHPWLKRKDVRAAFKVFDAQNCVFWKEPKVNPGGNV